MSDFELDIPGIEKGKRVETVEWGVRAPSWVRDPLTNGIEKAVDQAHARLLCEYTYWTGYETTESGVVATKTYHLELVSRVVVTYTTKWERA